MAKFHTSVQIGALIAGFSVLTACLGGLGVHGMLVGNRALQTVHDDRLVPIAQLNSIEGRMFRNRTALASAVIDPKPERVAESIKAVEGNIEAINKAWDAYMATRLTAEEDVLARKYALSRGQFVRDGLQPTLAALKGGDFDKAKQVVNDVLPKLHAPASEQLEALVELQKTVLAQEMQAATSYEQRLMLAMAALAALGLLAGVLHGVLVTRRLRRALGGEPHELAQVAEAVAQGDLGARIALREGDRGSVLSALKAMVDQLARSVSSVRANADAVAGSAGEIAQGNQNLSGRTEQQAAALQETAASMDELGSTVKQNADNARQANQLAMSASQVAVQGGEVVAQVVDTMKGINDSSKKIADIISVIDGIAFQTNILALNAAVEAARAGEQGRGFAVVAGEVRSLAQRSAEAAKEIKGLITASVERVEQGTDLVDRAGQTMQEVVASIKRVTDIMGEISAASAEQSSGVAQVGQAITQMDHATQQNASLVEQSAAAAEALRAQADALVQAVAAFRLSHEQSAPLAGGFGGAERRGPDRARNVVRPSFGQTRKAEPPRAEPVAGPSDAGLGMAAGAGAGAAAVSAAAATGTDDDWATF